MSDFWESLVDESYDFEREWIRSDDATMEECLDAIGSIESPAIEIGSGTGLLTRAVKATGVDVIGIDLSASLIEYAERQSDDIEYRHCSGNGEIPIEDSGWYNTVYSMFVFQHCEPRVVQAYISEAYRCLADGGILAFQYVTNCEPAEFSFQHLPADVEAYCEAAGFEVVENQQKLIPEWNWIRCVKR
ncbi:MAG: class I SAM-dependent methyltransferase [bacterium]